MTLKNYIPLKDRRDLYALYVELFKVVKANPELFPPMRLTAIFTSLMASQWWGWHVIGISKDAIKEYKINNYKHPRGKLQRGHLKMRANSTNTFFDLKKPMGMNKFFETYLAGDTTVIMTKEENASNKIPAGYFKIKNPKAELFQNAPIGWKHGSAETEYLKTLK
jgi:hypothetical protein